MRQWSVHSAATTANASDAGHAGSSVTGRALRASASAPSWTGSVTGAPVRSADGAGHIGIAVVVGTGARVV